LVEEGEHRCLHFCAFLHLTLPVLYLFVDYFLISFGKVFLVRPIRAPQSEVYAMKVLRKSEVVKRHQVEHTLTERYILATVRHPFILCLRHAFQTNDKLYMVTDYCPGGELFFHLKRLRRFTEGIV
jgi:serine/threonine protein kinase